MLHSAAGIPRKIASAEARVRVKTLEEHVHDREAEQHRGEPDDREPGRSGAPPAAGRAGMDVPGVEHPDDERPDFLGVEAPIATPRVIRPDRARDEREGPEDEA